MESGKPINLIVMIHPQEGVYNKILKPWVPLSILAAASKLDRAGYTIKVIDQRIDKFWKTELIETLNQGPLCVGITAMTGSQILGGLEASKVVKEHSRIPVVWGGVHATLFPRETLENPLVDIVVKAEGEVTFHQLVQRIQNGQGFEGLAGISYKNNGEIVDNPARPYLKLDELPDIPYHLVDVRKYLHQFFSEKDVLEIESSRGCPFACAFCYSPLYNQRKWRPLSSERTVQQIKKLASRYSINAFHFIDDAFFIDAERSNEIMRQIIKEHLNIKMGFQGVRIDTFDKLSDKDLELLIEAGGTFLQFGVESGSERILKMINKRIKIEQVTALNRRLAKFSQLKPYYNFMCGFPTETREDLFKTTSLAWQLLEENGNAMISPFHHYKPYPGTQLAPLATNYRDVTPSRLEEWGTFDWTHIIEGNVDRKLLRLRRNVETISILVDRKLENQSDSRFWALAGRLYRPVARFRFRHNLYSLMLVGGLRRICESDASATPSEPAC